MLKSVDIQCRLTRLSGVVGDPNVKIRQNSVYAEPMVLPAIQMLKSVDVQCRLNRVSGVVGDPNVKIRQNSAYAESMVLPLSLIHI